MDGGEEVVRVLVVARGHATEVLELVEVSLSVVAIAVEKRAEGRLPLAVQHGADVGPCPSRGEVLAQVIGVVGAVCEQDLAFADAAQHVLSAAPIMRLALGQLDGDRQPIGVDESVDLGGQSAAGAAHAAFRPPFLPLAACWWTRTDEELIICKSPS